MFRVWRTARDQVSVTWEFINCQVQFCFCRNCPDITCTECGRAGHMRRICPFRVRYYPKDKAEAAELRKQKAVKVGQFNQESGEIEEAGEWAAE